MGMIEEAIKNLGWVRAGNMEKVIRALMGVGIDPKKCFIDQNDNLIIPVSEIRRRTKMPNPRQGKVLFGIWLTGEEEKSMTWSLNNALRLTKKWEKLREKFPDGEEVWLNDQEEATLENAENNISEILIEAFKRGDFIKK